MGNQKKHITAKFDLSEVPELGGIDSDEVPDVYDIYLRIAKSIATMSTRSEYVCSFRTYILASPRFLSQYRLKLIVITSI